MELVRQYDELMSMEVEGACFREIIDQNPSVKLLKSYEDAGAQRVGAQDPT